MKVKIIAGTVICLAIVGAICFDKNGGLTAILGAIAGYLFAKAPAMKG